jgi:GNAT superfamily N-acetyltransferase
MSVRELAPEDIPRCAELLATLPEWFGFSDVNDAYIESLGQQPSFVSEVDGRVVGFIALERYGEVSAEIHVMAVERERHRQGIGRALVDRARTWCRDNEVRWLHVKTRGPSTPDSNYERTRLFYLAEGFDPLYESRTEWGPTNAALVLVQAVRSPDAP